MWVEIIRKVGDSIWGMLNQIWNYVGIIDSVITQAIYFFLGQPLHKGWNAFIFYSIAFPLYLIAWSVIVGIVVLVVIKLKKALRKLSIKKEG